jgi:hypothetical protein
LPIPNKSLTYIARAFHLPRFRACAFSASIADPASKTSNHRVTPKKKLTPRMLEKHNEPLFAQTMPSASIPNASDVLAPFIPKKNLSSYFPYEHPTSRGVALEHPKK